jgi:hypothetical protein
MRVTESMSLPLVRQLSSLPHVGLLRRALIASLVALLSLTAAATATASSNVHVVKTRSKIRTSDRSIIPGEDLFITGRLVSGKLACTADRIVQLWFKGRKVDAKATNNNGKAFFKKDPKTTGKWQIRFAGVRDGVSPDGYYCTPSRSGAIKVKVS